MKKKHELTTIKLKRKLWKVFTIYIKERDNWTCFTCGNIARGSGMSGGHFIPKAAGGLALYFHEDNVHAQCTRCNLFLEGNHYEYGIRLGKRRVAELYKLKHRVEKWTTEDYLQKIKIYETKLKQIRENNKANPHRAGGSKESSISSQEDNRTDNTNNWSDGEERSSTERNRGILRNQ